MQVDGSRSSAEEFLRRQMQYARKRTPEKRREEKMGHFQCSSDESGESEAGQLAPRAAPPAKKKTLREVTVDAQEAHKEMCNQAVASLARMNDLIAKLDRKLDDM